MSLDAYYQKLETKLLNQVTAPISFLKFINRKKFSWFERMFCKVLCERVIKLEEDVKVLASKPVKWNRYSNIKGKKK